MRKNTIITVEKSFYVKNECVTQNVAQEAFYRKETVDKDKWLTYKDLLVQETGVFIKSKEQLIANECSF